MCRALRIEFAGALYHVMTRSNARKPIFSDDPRMGSGWITPDFSDTTE